MKMKLLVWGLLALSVNLVAQDYATLSEITFSEASDYKVNEPKVEECATYILEQSIKSNELNKMYGLQYIMKWMEGTPDYTFSLDEDFTNLCKKDVGLSTVYMASLAKAAVSSSFTDKSTKAISKNAKQMFLNYCAAPENNVKLNKTIKKALMEKSEAKS